MSEKTYTFYGDGSRELSCIEDVTHKMQPFTISEICSIRIESGNHDSVYLKITEDSGKFFKIENNVAELYRLIMDNFPNNADVLFNTNAYLQRYVNHIVYWQKIRQNILMSGCILYPFLISAKIYQMKPKCITYVIQDHEEIKAIYPEHTVYCTMGCLLVKSESIARMLNTAVVFIGSSVLSYGIYKSFSSRM